MKKRIIFLFYFFYSIIIISKIYAGDIKIINKKDIKVDLGIRIALKYDYKFIDPEVETYNTHGFRLFAGKLNLKSEYKNWINFELSIDFSEIINQPEINFYKVINDLYFQFNFIEQARLRMGFFKIPFGEEFFFNLGERTHMLHTVPTKEICPGRDVGLLFSGKDLFNFIGYDLGFFNGNILTNFINIDYSDSILVAGKLFINQKFNKIFEYKVGYNAAYQQYTHTTDYYNFLQGVFGAIEFKPAKKQKLFFLAEYLEKITCNNTINNPIMSLVGISSILAYRIHSFESFLVFEFYDKILSESLFDDIILPGIGFNLYFAKELIILRSFYQVEYHFNSDITHHNINIMIQLEF